MTGFAFAIATCILLGITAATWFRVRTRKLAQSRPQSGLPQFVEYFRNHQVPPEVSTAVHEYLSNLKWMQHFPVEPKDRVFEIYRLQGEELVDAYAAILRTTGRELAQSRRADALTVDTVEELVRFVASLPVKAAVS
jgi:hypothetical protein